MACFQSSGVRKVVKVQFIREQSRCGKSRALSLFVQSEKIMTQLMKTENLRTIIITSTCHTLIHVILGELVKYMQNVDMVCQQNPERMINSRWN